MFYFHYRVFSLYLRSACCVDNIWTDSTNLADGIICLLATAFCAPLELFSGAVLLESRRVGGGDGNAWSKQCFGCWEENITTPQPPFSFISASHSIEMEPFLRYECALLWIFDVFLCTDLGGLVILPVQSQLFVISLSTEFKTEFCSSIDLSKLN